MDLDWYYTRAASIARKIYLNSGLGVGALARWYGKATRNGGKPSHHHYASRAVIRHALIQVRYMSSLVTYTAHRPLPRWPPYPRSCNPWAL